MIFEFIYIDNTISIVIDADSIDQAKVKLYALQGKLSNNNIDIKNIKYNKWRLKSNTIILKDLENLKDQMR